MMTQRECAIVSAYTGLLCGSFSWMHEYAQEKLGRPIFTHEFASKELALELREAAKEDFCNLSKSAEKLDIIHSLQEWE